jgi:hypothetical protein
VLARDTGDGEGEDSRAHRLTAIHMIECNEQFPGASRITGLISENLNGCRPEMATTAKEMIPEPIAGRIYSDQQNCSDV